MDDLYVIAESAIETMVPFALNVIGAIIILIFGFLVSKWTYKRVYNAAKNKAQIDDTVAPLLAKMARIGILALTIVIVLGNFGVETASLVAVLGVAGLAIGLALQGALSNVASGLMLLTFHPFKVGDFVGFGSTTGIVEEIGIFVTELRTLDNIAVVVPNSEVWGGAITNYTKKETRRVDMVFGIHYDDDIDKAFKIIDEVLKEDDRVLKDPEPLIAVADLGDSSVDIMVRPWTTTDDWWQFKLDTTKKIKQRFDQENITIPFPQRDVHMYPTNSAN